MYYKFVNNNQLNKRKMKNKLIYINRKDGKDIETVDEFPYNNKDERKEAIRCVQEYSLSDNTAEYYRSSRCTKEWRAKI